MPTSRQNFYIPITLLMRMIKYIRNWIIHCLCNGGCHLPDIIFKIV